MKNHEISFKNAKKDKNGYTTILVKFGEFFVPMKGRPLPLIKKDCPELDEIYRINLTRWNLKDIPEIAKLVGSLCGNGYDDLLYWNGYEGVWKFWNEGLGGIDNDDDDILDELDEKIEELECGDDLYQPHLDETGNLGDESVHCVYDGKSGISLWNDGFKHGGFSMSEIKSEDNQFVADLICYSCSNFYDAAIEAVEKACKSHKKIPYAEIGEAIRRRINGLNDEEIAKFFLRIKV